MVPLQVAIPRSCCAIPRSCCSAGLLGLVAAADFVVQLGSMSYTFVASASFLAVVANSANVIAQASRIIMQHHGPLFDIDGAETTVVNTGCMRGRVCHETSCRNFARVESFCLLRRIRRRHHIRQSAGPHPCYKSAARSQLHWCTSSNQRFITQFAIFSAR